MKIKNVLFGAVSISLFTVASVFAANTTFTDSGTVTVGTPAVSIKPSKNVSVIYSPSATASGAGTITYSISASHSSGTKSYASSSGDTKILWLRHWCRTTSKHLSANASANFTSGWTAL